MDQDQIVSLRNVVKTYPGAPSPALQIDELSIRPGEFFSLLGPSGSGKTTALRLIAGFEYADAGTVTIDGRNVTDVAPNQRDVNTVFQSYALFPHMTLRKNVDYPLWMKGIPAAERKKRVGEALEMVAMTTMADRYPHQVSGGQRQRVALARAFVGQPKVLLLDEPLSALDLNLRQQMQHLLVDLQRRIGVTFVYVTHDQGEALSMSNRVAVIAGGKVAQLSDPQTLYYKPASRFVAQFIGKSNIVPLSVQGAVAEFQDTRFALPGDKGSGPMEMAIRFEALSVCGSGETPQHPVRMQGKIADVLFMGNACEIKVKVGARDLIAQVPARHGHMPRHGDDVTVSFDPADCVVFHD